MTLVALSLTLMLLAGVSALALASRPPVAEGAFRLCMVAAAIAGAVPAIRVLAGGSVADVSISMPTPGGPWVFGLDALSAVFLLMILAAGTASAWFGVTYLRLTFTPRVAGASHFFVSVLMAALSGVVIARAALPFLAAWEIMALASYAAIVFEHQRPDVRRAGMLYLVATHAGTLALFALFAVWGTGARDLTFSSLAERSLAQGSQVAVLAAAMVGFGMKAGVVPFHFWLPEAHAAAPSHVSAIMSGVVIKMGIYGLLRVTLLMHAIPAWWGWLVLAAGSVSGVLGVVWAMAQHDIKRLLAYHSVENIGIILLGIGAGSLGLAYDHPVVALLGFAGAVLHTVNHALFKSLLFLGAGSVAHAAGTREIDRLGGIARRMPITAWTFLVGSAAIVGLPPLNGFLSEWLVFRSLLHAGLAADAARIAVLGVGALALIGALALACFAKAGGAIFLGSPRDAGIGVHESPRGVTAPLVALAAACVAVGVLPAVVLPPAFRAAALVAGVPITAAWAGGADPASLGVTWFAAGLAAAMALGWAARARARARSNAPLGATWACGFPLQTPRMQYTASSFAAPILAFYRGVSGVRTHRGSGTFTTEAADPVLDSLVVPMWRRFERSALAARPVQRGRLSLYLLYVVAALAAALGYLMIARQTP